MSVAIPGCTGLFSILHEAFRHEDKSRNCIRLSSTLHEFLDDFWWLAQDLDSRPTRIAELIQDQESVTNGAYDATTTGMGGVHFIFTADSEIPTLWR